MKKIFVHKFLIVLLAGCIGMLIIPMKSAAQFVLDGAYLNLSDGISTNPVFWVIDNTGTSGITRQTGGGHIYTDGQYNFVKWYTGTGTGNYVFPFGVAGTADDYIPFTFNKTSAGNSDVIASTWYTSQQNMPHPGVSDVSAVHVMTGTGDSVTSALDRFWDIRTSASATAALTFSYRSSENTTSQPSGKLKAQQWNGGSTSNPWNPPAGPGNTGVTSGIGTVGPIAGVTSFSPFVLVRGLAPLVRSSFALPRKKLDEGYYEAVGGLVYFNYYEEYLEGTLQFKVYDSDRNVVISNTVQSGAINTTVKNRGNNGYVLNCVCGMGTGYYMLEITNDKKEVVKLRFHYDASLYPPC